MKRFEVTFNLMGSKYPTTVYLEEDRMKALYDAMNRGVKIVELDGNYFNTAYFIQAVPASEKMEFQVSQEKLVEKGIIDSSEETQKRIELTQARHDLSRKMIVSTKNIIQSL